MSSGHHRRIKRRPSATVRAVGGIEGIKLHRLDGVEHEPSKVILRQPLTHVRWHQERLLAITRDKPLRHAGIVLNGPDGIPTYATAPDGSSYVMRWSRDAVYAVASRA